MKLVDLKNKYKKLNICSIGTKIKLIEKLKNAQKIINNNDEEQLKQNTIVPLASEPLAQTV